MLTEIDVERLLSFSIGFERGEKKGLEEDLARGVEEGLENRCIAERWVTASQPGRQARSH